MTGWEKVANPAERAVAVMQSRDNWFYFTHFRSRWGEDTLQELLESEVVRRPLVNILQLEPEYCAREQWELGYAKMHGESGLRKELRRLLRERKRILERNLAEFESGELESYPGSKESAQEGDKE